MTDLFKKLNTLVKASISDLLDDVTPDTLHRVPDPLSKQMDRDIAALRKRINEAIEHEDVLQERVATLSAEVVRLDRQADEAVLQGNETAARHLIQQMQRAQQRLEMAESDLREHQLVAQELIQKVNILEATVAAARRAQAEQPEEEATPEARSPARSLAAMLKEAQEKLAGQTSAQEEITASLSEEDLSADSGEAAVEDDLAVRRDRLSKR